MGGKLLKIWGSNLHSRRSNFFLSFFLFVSKFSIKKRISLFSTIFEYLVLQIKPSVGTGPKGKSQKAIPLICRDVMYNRNLPTLYFYFFFQNNSFVLLTRDRKEGKLLFMGFLFRQLKNILQKIPQKVFLFMDCVRDGEILGRSLVFLKAHCPCILPRLTQSMGQQFSYLLKRIF